MLQRKLPLLLALCLMTGFSLLGFFNPFWFYLVPEIGLGMFSIIFVISRKHEKISSSSPEKETEDPSPEQTGRDTKKIHSSRYQELLKLWTLQTESLEKMFHKSNEVNLFSMLEFETLEKEFKKIDVLLNHTEQIKNHSQDVSSEIIQIAESSSKIKNGAEESITHSDKASQKMTEIDSANETLRKSVNLLMAGMKNIESFLANIAQISKKTRTLSINASIEASKAGIHGSGFAVLAREIRTLAENTGQYTENIHDVLSSIREDSKKVLSSMETNSHEIHQGKSYVQETASKMKELYDLTKEIDRMIQNISQTLKKEAHGIESVFFNITELRKDSDETKQQAEHLKAIAEELSHLGETSLNSAIQIPGKSPLFKLIRQAERSRVQIEEELEKLLQDGKITENDLFQPQFRAVPGTNPERHDCDYQPEVCRVIQPILQSYKDNIPAMINFAINDLYNYVPVTPKEFNQPLTGDPQKDALINFTRRIYTHERTTKMNEAVSEKDFYLSSYPRLDFKMTLSDLAFPIYVRGKRWGTGRIGFNPDKIKKGE